MRTCERCLEQHGNRRKCLYCGRRVCRHCVGISVRDLGGPACEDCRLPGEGPEPPAAAIPRAEVFGG